MKSLQLITGLPKPAWLWTWFRNNWLRMVVAGSGLHDFISVCFGSFLTVANFSTVDRSVFHTYENHRMVLKIKKQSNFIFSSLVT